MLNCMIYTLFPLLRLGFKCLRVFVDFNLVIPKHFRRMKIFRPCGSKNVAKEAQRHQHGHTVTSTSVQEDIGRSSGANQRHSVKW